MTVLNLVKVGLIALGVAGSGIAAKLTLFASDCPIPCPFCP